MSRVDELLHAFVTEFRAAGDADPRPYLRQLDGTDRGELTALIDHFLATEPPPAFDPAAFAAFTADGARDALVTSVLDEPAPLLELRQAAGLTKAAVGELLAAELELAGQEQAAKGAYHEIETGLVAPGRVRDRIWDVLGRAYGTSVDQLRRAAEAAFEARPASSDRVAFARGGEPAAGPSRASAPESPGDTAVREAFFMD